MTRCCGIRITNLHVVGCVCVEPLLLVAMARPAATVQRSGGPDLHPFSAYCTTKAATHDLKYGLVDTEVKKSMSSGWRSNVPDTEDAMPECVEDARPTSHAVHARACAVGGKLDEDQIGVDDLEHFRFDCATVSTSHVCHKDVTHCGKESL